MLQSISPDRTYTLDEACNLLGLQKSYLYKLVTQGIFTTTRDTRDKRVRRVSESQLIAFKPDVRFKLTAYQGAAQESDTVPNDTDVSNIIEGLGKGLDTVNNTVSTYNFLLSKKIAAR